jgi:hypothetical protein
MGIGIVLYKFSNWLEPRDLFESYSYVKPRGLFYFLCIILFQLVKMHAKCNNMDMNVYNMRGFFASFVNGIAWVIEVVPSNVEDNTLSIIKKRDP